MSNYRFIVSGGGTGGHIYPAIAIANALRDRYPEARFLFVGAKNRMEMSKVPQAGYEIEGLWISGLSRRNMFKNLLFPVKLLSSLWKASRIIKRFKPDMVIGTGGYASGPLIKMAAMKGLLYVIQEQNSYPGITNKLLARKAEKVFVAYDGMGRFFRGADIVKTGNPVRQDLLTIYGKRGEAQKHFKLKENKTTLLVVGGSQGARRVNQLIEKELDFFETHEVQLLWQCGKLYYDEYKEHDKDTVKVHAFLNRMDLAYAAADIIVSRAGAGAVSELCIVGKPVIFIPSPNVAEDHQAKNARAIADKNAAIIIEESELDTDFESEFRALLLSKERQMQLGGNIHKMAIPEATEHIIDEIAEILEPLLEDDIQ